jgi:hypothetical protein
MYTLDVSVRSWFVGERVTARRPAALLTKTYVACLWLVPGFYFLGVGRTTCRYSAFAGTFAASVRLSSRIQIVLDLVNNRAAAKVAQAFSLCVRCL